VLAAGSFSAPAIDQTGQVRLDGEVENNDGRLCVTLTNNADRPLEGIAVIALGSDADQAEIGRFPFRLESRSNGYFRIRSVQITGSYYRLRILSPAGDLLLYRAAPIKRVSDASTALEVTLAAAVERPSVINNRPAAGEPAPQPAASEPEEVSVRAQLLGNPADPDSFAIFFELRSRRPVRGAKLSITAGKFSDSKPVSLEPSSMVQFQLPGRGSPAGEFDRIEYTLIEKDGRQLARGALELEKLMADDAITVLDVRTNRPSYSIGATVKLTVLLEGRSPTGYRLEVTLRDYNGTAHFQDQRFGDGQAALTPQEFTFILPAGAQQPLVFEYKLFNPETGLLFDSGEFEIPVEDKPF